MRAVPPYIAKSGVADLPLQFTWKGQGMHYGPSQGTKLHNELAKLTTLALATVTTLCAEWLIWRLRGGIDAERLLHYLDATLAWTVDWRYRDQSSLKLPKDTPVNQAVLDGIWLVQLTTEDRLWRRPGLPNDKTAALVSVTKQTLTAKEQKSYLAWVQSAVETAQRLGSHPAQKWPQWRDFNSDEPAYKQAVAPFLGTTIPREAFDPDSGYKPAQREELIQRFLAGLDPKMNPFLRTPEAMKELGFEGTPYRL